MFDSQSFLEVSIYVLVGFVVCLGYALFNFVSHLLACIGALFLEWVSFMIQQWRC